MVHETSARARSMSCWAASAGALLTGLALLLLAVVPAVPSEAADLAIWADDARTLLSWSDELLFFAIVAWGAGARGLFGRRHGDVSIDIGTTALAVALVSLTVVLLTVGRLVYPVFGITLSPDATALLVSVVFGAVHLAYLGFAVAAIALSWSTGAGRVVGLVAATAFIAGSFPWLTPAWWNTFTAVLLGVWGVFLAVTTAHRDRPRNQPA